MKVRDILNHLDDEVWVEVVPENGEGKGLDLMVWTADWIGGAYWPEDLNRFLGWEVDGIRIKMGRSPETGKRTPVLVVPATKPERRQGRQTTAGGMR